MNEIIDSGGVRFMVIVRIKVQFRDYSSGIASRSCFEEKNNAMFHRLIQIETACDSPALLKLKNILEDIKCEQKKCSRTAKVWLTYMDYIDSSFVQRGLATGTCIS